MSHDSASAVTGNKMSVDYGIHTSARLHKLQELQDVTYEEMCALLDTYHLCNIERPTGFGKTRLFMRYAADHKNSKILYVYDVNSVVDSIVKIYSPSNVDFVSYSKISLTSSQEDVRDMLLGSTYHTVIFDESHLLGGSNIQRIVSEMIPHIINSGRYVLGGTATPLRTDMVNVTDQFFNGVRPFSYTLEDAFTDGIIIPPYWTAMVHVGSLIEELRTRCKDNSYQLKKLRQLDLAYAERVGAPKIYHDTVVDCFGKVPSYMKFIAFYPTISSLCGNIEAITRDFEQAFPGHTVRVYPVSSDPEHPVECAPLHSDVVKENAIDLILAVNMLNQAYHSNTLTGIIMNRSTLSNVVFTQQLGRCLSVTGTNRTIVFDNVGNAKASLIDLINSLNLAGDNQPQSSRGIYEVRGHFDLMLHVKPELLHFSEWYSRIKATIDLTQEQVDMAKRMYSKFGVKEEDVSSYTGVPRWVLHSELGLEDNSKWESQ